MAEPEIQQDAAEDSEWELGNQLFMLAQAANQDVTILVVDDEPEIVEEITEDLQFEGFTCRSACNAHEALDVIEGDEAIGIIVSDIRMPNMDGLEFLAALKERCPNRTLQVIMLTGHAGYDEAVQALRLGAFEFLAKPVSLDHLGHVINRAKEVLQLRAHEKNLREFLVREIARLNARIDSLSSENETLRSNRDA
ncbi:MAG: response regulator [Magnetospirillum sp.]|nr:response regulator [Magnetospirillum sp.]